ncbi:MAG: hypothetical protein CL608_01485 [Anaerolineaceae bacterium]|nr:hypothetical protein [Anaerolineaceae bacterium]
MTRTRQFYDNAARWLSRHAAVWSILIFLAAVLPRLFSPISRPHQWDERSFLFREALLNQDWAATYQQYHPGVTLMWLSALGIQLFTMRYGPITQEMWFLEVPTPPGLMETGLAYAVAPLAVAISLCIVIVYWLLTKLADRRLAIVAALLLAWDPFYLTYSRVEHVDGLLASLMFVSGLFVMLYGRTAQRRYLLGSGLFAGLAFLTKTPAIFLVPFTGLILLATQIDRLRQQDQLRSGRAWGRLVGTVSRDVLLWGATAVLLFVLLFPALWFKGDQILTEMWSNLIRRASTPHKNPIYFAGTATIQDPGPLYYLAMLAWGTTAVTLPASLVGAGIALVRGWRPQASSRVRLALAVFVYAFFFTIQMSLGDSKLFAYILPAFPALDVLAAVGLVALADGVQRWRKRARLSWGTLILTVLLGLQAALVLPLHPHFGTHYNALLGGTRVALRIFPIQDQGEGLELAATFLNQLPHSQTATASVFERNIRVFRRVYAAQTSKFMNPDHEFRVYDVHSLQRNMTEVSDDWQMAWAADQEREPLFTVVFDGVTYVWVYGEIPTAPVADGITFAPKARFGDHLQLESTIVSREVVAPGDTLTIVHYWQSDGRAAGEVKVFNHLLDESGQPVAQRDDVPMDGIRPLNTWTLGEQMEDVYQMEIPADAAPGDYYLVVGFYDPATFARMPAFAADGSRFANDTAVVGTITITAP